MNKNFTRDRLDRHDILDAIAELLDDTQYNEGYFQAGVDSADDSTVVLEVIYEDTPVVDEFTIRVSKTRKSS